MPCFDDGPIERRHQQVRTALAPEILLDLRIVIKVVKYGHVIRKVRRTCPEREARKAPSALGMRVLRLLRALAESLS